MARPLLANNGTCQELSGREYEVGSLPPGALITMYNIHAQEMVSGLVEWSNQSRTVVWWVSEGDANFDGSMENGTLHRINRLERGVTIANDTPVEWLGVDEEFAQQLKEEQEWWDRTIGRVGVERPRLVASSPDQRVALLLPVVSLDPQSWGEETD